MACFQGDNISAVIVDCPTCGTALKNEFPAMMRKFGLDDTAALAIAAKTTDLMSFLHYHLELLEFAKNETKPPPTVSYHFVRKSRLKSSKRARIILA